MDKKKPVSKLFFRYAVIVLGCAIYSLGVALFLDANDLAAGGVTGIAIMINFLTGWDVGWLIAVINIPLFILAAIFFGKYFTLSTLFSTLLSSLLIEFWAHIFRDVPPLTENVLIAAICGGGLYGLGLGMIFRMGSSTGGTDIVVKILRKKFRAMRTGIISMILDVIIVAASAFVYKDFELLFYTVVSIVLFTICFDWVLYGGNSAKMVYIIPSDDSLAAEICRRAMHDLDLGVTYVEGEGAYTGKKRKVMLCAVKNYLYPKLRDVVRDTDKNAFMIVSSANDIYGEGYKGHDEEEL